MPIYILHDHVMNGTVTMQTEITGIESDNFAAAVSKARRWLDSLGSKLINISVTDADLTAEIDIGEPGIREFIGMNDMPLRVVTKAS